MMAHGGTYRGIYTKLLDDDDFQMLSVPARLTLLVLRLSPQNNAASIFRMYPDVLSEQTGLTREQLDAALDELQRQPSPDAPWILREGSIIWIRNGLRYDPSVKPNNIKHHVAIAKALNGLPRRAIVRAFRSYYGLPTDSEDPENSPWHGASDRASDSLSHGVSPDRLSNGLADRASTADILHIGYRWPIETLSSPKPNPNPNTDNRLVLNRVSDRDTDSPSAKLALKPGCDHVGPGADMCDACADRVRQQLRALHDRPRAEPEPDASGDSGSARAAVRSLNDRVRELRAVESSRPRRMLTT